MKNLYKTFSFLLCIILLASLTINAQLREQRTNQDQTFQEPLDINSKAEELGISAEQLSSILNSASSGSGEGDPLPDAMQERFFTGAAAEDRFGISVSTAGDVNGDGYDDIIVGAPYNDAIATNAGRAYIYFGGNIIDNIPDVILIAENATDGNFGWAVSGAGDVNGDGYDDVIVGAPWTDFAGTDAGTFYIFFGGSPMNGVFDFLQDGYAAGDQIGYSIKTAGDVNGDGYADVIVGAPYNDAGGIDAGSAYIYFGGAIMNNPADVIITGTAAGDEFGYSVASAGDVNGDGYSDVIIGARYNDAGGTDAGSAYIYFGGTGMNNIVDLILRGAAAYDWFGYSVSSAGDVNGDGFIDVIVGAYGNDAGGFGAGRAYVYLGGSSMNDAADVTLTGAAAGDFFGFSVSTARDANGDGYDDIIVGAPFNSAGGTNLGRAYTFFGGSNMDNTADVILTGAAAGDWFGVSVSTAGDVNGDGYSDLIVGAQLNDAGGTNAGRAYLYQNSLTGTDIPDEFFTGAAAGDFFGISVSTAGDVNGDGYADIIVGAIYNDAGGTNAGSAYIYFGGSALDNTADVTLTGAAAGDAFGFSVSTAGDVNGDGYSDVIVGATANDAGSAYIYYGGSSMNNSVDVILTGVAAVDAFGYSVSTAGDVNGDGYADVIVGAVFNDAGGSNAGEAYIYFGGSLMDNTADVILTGTAAGDEFGISASTAGDVNGDGYADIIVGAYLNDAGGIDAGRAYIYFGGASMNEIADITLTGEASDDKFGSSVSTAGDVNGDGYTDVIVGANFNDAGESNAGRAYIYFGGSIMNNTADVILTGAAASDYFGSSVSTAGDVNGDGYSDVIVGAYANDAGGTNAGRAYIYFGGSSMNNSADVIMTGAADDNYFGNSVSSAGDVNGDGHSDVIVGAYANDAGGEQAGRAYLYLSSSPPIKPRIMTVKDVPFDQGGYVFLNFVRSGYDAQGESNIITEYLIEMSNPPGINGFSWIQIGSVQPVQNPLYTFIAETPNDSMINNSGTYYFRVTARTADPNQYWPSNIMYGHSVDNLSPLPPMNFYASLLTSQVKLGWKANTEPDFRDYYIYRSDLPVNSFNFNEGLRESDSPDAFTLIATTTDTTFIDPSPLTGNAYYYIQAYDVHDNGSPYSSDSVMAFLSANVKLYLEGPYVGGQMSTFLNSSGSIPLAQPFNTAPWNYTGTETVTSIPANVTDWILVELRSTTTTVVDRRAAFIKNDGTLVDLDGISNIKFATATAGDYYVVITHRNHLSIMTATPITISFNPTLYDMRNNASNVYGTNAVKNLGDGNYGMISGDANGNGQIQNNDSETYWAVQNGQSGYKEGDYNLNNQVQNNDRETYWVPNNGRGTQVPVGTLLMVKNNNIINIEVAK